jgi:Protein of unknown function (DUF1553)/Protein of unknown function (DUF1549)
MRGHWLWLAAFGLLGLPGAGKLAAADENPCTPTKPPPASPTKVLNALEMAARIDAIIDPSLAAAKVKPAPLADDAEFCRRVFLDVIGRIPRAPEVHDFLDDTSPNKRQQWLETMLDPSSQGADYGTHARYIYHFTNVWRAVLLPQGNNPQFQALVPTFENYLRDCVRENKPYDRMVREILTTPLGGPPQMQRQASDPSKYTPVAFYQVNELKPENLAASTSRLFLGVKLECAQCHDHPHAQWKRKQFWELAAFFSGVESRGQPAPFGTGSEVADRRSIKIPGTDKLVQARFLDGSEPRWPAATPSRNVLASWITTGENRYFSRAAANRLWAHFFGIGLAEPVDDLSDLNPPSHPELLDELAHQFAANKYDIKYLIRAIVNSKTYQRSSVVTNPNQNEPRLFARMSVKGMSPEQFFDSLLEATRFKGQERSAAPQFGQPDLSLRAQFLSRFSSQDKRTEYHTSILQALALMNGKFIEGETSLKNLEHSETLLIVVDSPFYVNTAARIETLYLQTLSRKPRPEERERLVHYVDSGGPRHDSKEALADVFWALLNSAEFMLNH